MGAFAIHATSKPDGKAERTPWFARLTYALQSGNGTITFFIFVLYWALEYRPAKGVEGITVMIHGVNFLLALIDILVLAKLPVKMAQVWVPCLFGLMYVLFSLFYDVAGGTNQRGNPYIYGVLDWSGNPGIAVGVGCGVVLVAFPLFFALCIGINVWRATCNCCQTKNAKYAASDGHTD